MSNWSPEPHELAYNHGGDEDEEHEHPGGESNEKNRGIYAKYEVKNLTDIDGKHDDCRYFVLDPQHDESARRALVDYAVYCEQEGHVKLASDIYSWLREIKK